MAGHDEPFDITQVCVTTAQMQAIEAQIFGAGFPVAALMEKVAGRIVGYWLKQWPRPDPGPQRSGQVGVLVGPGHNGGDALVVARELYLKGYDVRIYGPFEGAKPLTADHGQYCSSLGIPWYRSWEALAETLHPGSRLLDGLFGFGLSRPLTGEVAAAVDDINRRQLPVVSIDLPAGIHTDSGQPLGTALRAETTLCLGLWKRACLQEAAQPYLGNTHLIEFDIPSANVEAVLGPVPAVQRLTAPQALSMLPLQQLQLRHWEYAVFVAPGYQSQ